MAVEKQKQVGSIDSGCEATVLEIVVGECRGEAVILLQLCTWNEEIGRQVQKTISFSADKLGQLQRLLSQARSQIEDSQRGVCGTAQVIPLRARGAVPHHQALINQSARQTETAVGLSS